MISKQINTVKELIIFLENEIICDIFEYLKTGKFQIKINILSFSYSEIQKISDHGDYQSGTLFKYYKQIIENYIIDCTKKLRLENNNNLIDAFLFHTKNINFLIYWMYKIFRYLDRFYVYTKTGTTLSGNAMNLYKSIFYEKFKNQIQNEIDNLKNAKNDNQESDAKIQSVMKILQDIKLNLPKIIKENNEIKWIEDPEKHYRFNKTFNKYKF